MNNNRLSFPNGFEKTEVRWGKIKIKLAPNVWCYTLVLMAYSTCYLLVRFISKELELERKRFFFSFLCGGENKK